MFCQNLEKVILPQQVLTRNLITLLVKYGSRKYKYIYVKNKGANLNVMTMVLKFGNCEILGSNESFEGTCFGHSFSKTWQYVTTRKEFAKKIKYMSIKVVQLNVQKCITWPKKLKESK